MKSIELLGVGLRVAGIYGLIHSAQFLIASAYVLSSYANNAEEGGLDGWYLMHAGVLLFTVFACIILIKFPATIASWLMPKTTKQGSDLSQSASDLQTVALSILGVFVLTYSIPEVVQNAYLWWQAKDLSILSGMLNPTEKFAAVLYSVIQLLIALYLVIQAKGLSRLIIKLRYSAT